MCRRADLSRSRALRDCPGSVVVPHTRPTLKLQSAAAATGSIRFDRSIARRSAPRAAVHGASTGMRRRTRPIWRVRTNCAPGNAAHCGGDVEPFIFEFAPREQVADVAPDGRNRSRRRPRPLQSVPDHRGPLLLHLPAAARARPTCSCSAVMQALAHRRTALSVVAGSFDGKFYAPQCFRRLSPPRYDHLIPSVADPLVPRSGTPYHHVKSSARLRDCRGGPRRFASPYVLVIRRSALARGAVAAWCGPGGRLVFDNRSRRRLRRRRLAVIARSPPIAARRYGGSLLGRIACRGAQLLCPKGSRRRIAAREVLLAPRGAKALRGAHCSCRSRWKSPWASHDHYVHSLGALVRDGVVEIREACGAAPDRAALIAALERDGVDVSGVQRRA